MIEQILSIVRNIPVGHIASYGDVAKAAGLPHGARLVGRILGQHGHDVPWHRVVNRNGQITIQHPHLGPEHQMTLLKNEGVSCEMGSDNLYVVQEPVWWIPSL